MNEDIIDEKEKYTGPRICPECGHQFPFKEFAKRYFMSYLFSYGVSNWTCQNCRELLKCDSIKIQIIWLVGFLFLVVLLGISLASFELGLISIIFIVPYFAFILLTLFYAKFEKN